ncbi:MAG: Tex family protein, partial [Acidobacteriota bacterium]
MPSIAERIAAELNVRLPQVDATISLLDGKATVPFIARYRKEATGGLDDTQLRTLEERLGYLRELEERRAAIRKSVEEQGKLTPELAQSIQDADTKARLEDLYLPYKPKRRTKAQMAREAGLEPLALGLLEDPGLVPEHAAAAYVDAARGITDVAAALDGARAILMERFAEDAELVGGLRQLVWDRAEWQSKVVDGKEEEGAKFSDYFNASEPIRQIPSHRALALLRGRKEGVLRLAVVLPDVDGASGAAEPHARIAARAGIANAGRPGDAWLVETVRWSWKFKLMVHLEFEAEQRLREQAEAEAIRVFGQNLHDLLLAAPAGQRVTMGLDPGIRTGVKVAVVDGTGKLLETATVYPHQPRNDREGALRALAGLCAKHHVQLISIGNGTASRETDALVGDLITRHPELQLTRAVVSEAGASVYSASELGAKEFPDLDVSLRGAVSIARRLQDPLAELVRIEPRAIGVGQYQHDVSQTQLARKLDTIVEDCVNAVGADVNTASAPLLAHISGLSESIARNLVSFRDEHGPFQDRRQILKVPRLGERAFQQAAGFLRIMDGRNPLDASAVHPEAYPVVERIVSRTGVPVHDLIGKTPVLRALRAEDFADAQFGVPTVKDILAELEKPGRDPRPEFRTAAFKDSVRELGDLEPGMQLEGVVTNVANFGACVDIGV